MNTIVKTLKKFFQDKTTKRKVKCFKIDEGVDRLFVEKCEEVKAGQSYIIESLILSWLVMRKKSDQRYARIYKKKDRFE